MRRKIENIVFDCIIYIGAFLAMYAFVYVCSLADQLMGVS